MTQTAGPFMNRQLAELTNTLAGNHYSCRATEFGAFGLGYRFFHLFQWHAHRDDIGGSRGNQVNRHVVGLAKEQPYLYTNIRDDALLAVCYDSNQLARVAVAGFDLGVEAKFEYLGELSRCCLHALSILFSRSWGDYPPGATSHFARL